jgi:hypothetical protein
VLFVLVQNLKSFETFPKLQRVNAEGVTQILISLNSKQYCFTRDKSELQKTWRLLNFEKILKKSRLKLQMHTQIWKYLFRMRAERKNRIFLKAMHLQKTLQSPGKWYIWIVNSVIHLFSPKFWWHIAKILYFHVLQKQ